MRLYLHIGLSKTGTSAIQTFLYRNRERLLKKFKVLYPQTGIFMGGGIPAHYSLAFSLFKPNEAKSLNVVPFEDLMDQLKREMDEAKPEEVVISSEAFMHYKDEPVLEKFSLALNELFEEIYILVYLRRQDLWQESSYSQVIKDYSMRVKVIFKKSVEYSKTLNWLLMYDRFLNRWKTFFPKANITPRIYDKKELPNGDVIQDFLNILGIQYKELENLKSDPNPSISHLSTLVLRKINEKFDLTLDEHEKVLKYIFKLDKEEGSPLKTFFTLPERIAFLEYFRESNERLFREWFNSENKFVLSEEEIKFYEEQDKIPREEIEKMVEDRYRKVITYLVEQKGSFADLKRSIQEPEIKYYPTGEVEFVVVDVLQLDLLKKGKFRIGGLVLLKKDIEGVYRLTIKDGEGEKEIRWGLPSPVLASRYPDNSKAKEARFEIDSVSINKDSPLEIYLKEKDTSKLLVRINLGGVRA